MGDEYADQSVLQQISKEFDEALLVKILQETNHADNVKDLRYKLTNATARGDSYLSTVNRIKVEGTTNDGKNISASIIVKSLPKNLGRRKTFRSEEFFRNEANFYNKALPALLNFQKKKSPKSPFLEVPRCFKALADGVNDFIVMEDLGTLGFRAAARIEGLDIDHCSKVLRCLGRFHGLSFAMKDQEPEEFMKAASALSETYYKEETRDWYIEQLGVFLDVALDAVSKEFPGSKYETKMKEFAESSVFDRMIDFVKPREPYSVISNGDAWTNNFLFSYEGSSAKDVRMIDFQLSRYGSPILDLSFFMYSCMTKELWDLHYKDLLNTYYNGLSSIIRDLGSNPDKLFPFEVFENEVKSLSTYGFGMSLESVPLAMMDETEAPDIDLIDGDEAVPLSKIWIVPHIKNKEKRLRLANNIIHAVNSGHI